MARNGSGTHVRLYDWETDKANSVKIRADRMDGEFDDIANELTNSIAKDGQTTPTANLPMGTFKHTGVGAASSRTDYLRASQAQDNDLTYFTASGTDTYAVSPSPAISAYASGQGLYVKFTNANTGAATLDWGPGAKDIKKNGAVALAAGDIAAGRIYHCVYDGTNIQLLSVGASLSGQSMKLAIALR